MSTGITAQGGTDRLNRMLKLYHSTSAENFSGRRFDGANSLFGADSGQLVPRKFAPSALAPVLEDFPCPRDVTTVCRCASKLRPPDNRAAQVHFGGKKSHEQ